MAIVSVLAAMSINSLGMPFFPSFSVVVLLLVCLVLLGYVLKNCRRDHNYH